MSESITLVNSGGPVNRGAGNGGDVRFIAGARPFRFRPGSGGKPDGRDGDIIFQLANGLETLRLCGDGRVMVNGELVATNREVYERFCFWLDTAIGRRMPPTGDGEWVKFQPSEIGKREPPSSSDVRQDIIKEP